MINRVILLTIGTAAIVQLGGLAGCSGGGGGSGSDQPTVDQASMVGTWLEVREETGDAPDDPRLPTPKRLPYLRQMTFAADNSFKLIACKKDGKPLDPSKAIEGTWKIEDGEVYFESIKHKMGDKFQNWTPEECAGLQNTAGGVRLIIYHADGSRIAYERTGS